MKKSFIRTLFMLIVPVVCIQACKKNKSSLLGETVLSKEFENDVMVREYLYNSQGQLETLNEYDETSGKLDYATRFSYNAAGILKNILYYNSSGKATANATYTSDDKGYFLKEEYVPLTGADSGHITVRIKYTYDGNGHIAKEAWVDLVTDKDMYYRKYTWYANGNLKSYSYYEKLSPTPEVKWKSDYTPEADPLPESIVSHRGYPINFLLCYFSAANIHFYDYNGAVVITEYEEKMTDRQYNDAGFMTAQTITTHYIQPAKADEVKKMKYEYIKI